ncbi:MAG TPA: hypothetical protein VM166_01580 [Gemmatimonadaceae bacterium]|nr:hypothetical protein [Gemmatimonadaceae bacterium]
MTVDPGDRELFAQFLGVTVVGLDVDLTLEEERRRPAIPTRKRQGVRHVE